MFLANGHSDYRSALDTRDAETLGVKAAEEVERFLRHRENHVVTPLRALPALARELGVEAIDIKDEGLRLGLGSFKALGGSYAVIRLVLDAASERLGRPIDVTALRLAPCARCCRRNDFRLRHRRQSRTLGGPRRRACGRKIGRLRSFRRQRATRRRDRPLRRRNGPGGGLVRRFRRRGREGRGQEPLDNRLRHILAGV